MWSGYNKMLLNNKLIIAVIALLLNYAVAAAAAETDNKIIEQPNPICIDEIEEFNKNSLISSLQDGWNTFCECDVDEGVQSFYPGSDVADVQIHVCSTNGSVTWPIKDMCHVTTKNFDPRKKTIIFANGWVSDGVYDIKKKVEEIVSCSHEYNVLIVDFATCIEHLYKSDKHNIPVNAYALLKLIDVLLLHDVLYHDIIMVGFSVGAQIAALTCKLYAEDRKNEQKLPLLVAIDPAFTCSPEHYYVHKDVAQQVLVYHGNNGNYGIRDPVGCVDFYPNGDGKLQAGCKSQVCSHVFPLWIFIESVCYPGNFLATKCNDWHSFTKGKCMGNDIVPINLDTPHSVEGKYYCETGQHSPYGLGYAGTKPSKFKFSSNSKTY